MGWYFAPDDEKLTCATCGKEIESGSKIYFLDGGKQEHFICFWNRNEAKAEAK